MIRPTLLIATGALALAGCGSAASTHSTHAATTSQPTAVGSKPEACPQTLVLLQQQGQGLPGIEGANASLKNYGAAVATTDDLIASLKLLQSQLGNPVDKSTVGEGLAAEQHLETAERALAGGNSAISELVGLAPAIGGLIRKVIAIC